MSRPIISTSTQSCGLRIISLIARILWSLFRMPVSSWMSSAKKLFISSITSSLTIQAITTNSKKQEKRNWFSPKRHKRRRNCKFRTYNHSLTSSDIMLNEQVSSNRALKRWQRCPWSNRSSKTQHAFSNSRSLRKCARHYSVLRKACSAMTKLI